MIIAVDFDGTLVKNEYPNIGTPNLELVDNLKNWKEKGNTLILWTCRTGDLLKTAIDYCASLGLNFDKINEDSDIFLNKYKVASRKVGADIYIDDRAMTADTFNNIVFNLGR